MKHIKTINEYFSNINEGVNYNSAHNANLEELGYTVANGSGKNPDDMGKDDLEELATETLKKAKPFALTGNAKKDIAALLKYVGDAFKRCDIELDVDNTTVDSMDFQNELFIPVADTDYFLNTHLAYEELFVSAANSIITLGAAFGSEDEGILDFHIYDLGDNGDIVKVCADFKQYLKNQKK
jgi:hypothetical protein